MENKKDVKPLAIAMWDCAWIESRNIGEEFEDWDLALNELVERGYNALRIDPFPHFLSLNKENEWQIVLAQTPERSTLRKIQIQPALCSFLEKCKILNIKVALSTSYRLDDTNSRMTIESAEVMAKYWEDTLTEIKNAGFLDLIISVDLCQAWPNPSKAPFFKNIPDGAEKDAWYTEISIEWMTKVVTLLKINFSEIPFTFSIEPNSHLSKYTIDYFDFMEPHILMAHENNSEFYKTLENSENTNIYDIQNIVELGEILYNKKAHYWDMLLLQHVNYMRDMSVMQALPLVTTECWSIDIFPNLNGTGDWSWFKELCAIGTKTAAISGRWLAIATCNYCTPKYKTIWADVNWHKRLTSLIKSGRVDKNIRESLLAKRIIL